MDEGIVRIFNNSSLDGLQVRIIGKKIYKYDTISSTNDIAFSHGLKGEREGAVFWARSQTKGRGRLGRVWVSRKDKGLYFSVILRPEVTVKDTSGLTLMAAVAISCALGKYCPKEFLIKWPNDIVVNDRKIGGILTEVDAQIQRVKFVILGIGVNTNMAGKELPMKEATSLKIETSRDIEHQGLMNFCLKELDDYYFEFKKHGISKIIDEARHLSSLWGRQVKIEDLNLPKSSPKAQWFWEGTAVDFGKDGSLVIRQNNGFLKHIFSGEVKLLKRV